MSYTIPIRLPFSSMPDHIKLWVICEYYHRQKLAPVQGVMGFENDEIEAEIHRYHIAARQCETLIRQVNGSHDNQTVTD